MGVRFRRRKPIVRDELFWLQKLHLWAQIFVCVVTIVGGGFSAWIYVTKELSIRSEKIDSQFVGLWQSDIKSEMVFCNFCRKTPLTARSLALTLNSNNGSFYGTLNASPFDDFGEAIKESENKKELDMHTFSEFMVYGNLLVEGRRFGNKVALRIFDYVDGIKTYFASAELSADNGFLKWNLKRGEGHNFPFEANLIFVEKIDMPDNEER